MADKIWMITGATRGIGRVIAESVLQAGGRVVAGARNPADLASLRAKYPDRCLPVRQDMDNAATLERSVAEACMAFGHIDVLVNNAGYGLHGAVEEVTMEQVRRQMETNFFGLVDLTQRVIPQMRERRSGYIVNISSIAGMRGRAFFSIYNASKFAVEGFSEALAQELAPFNVRVSLVAPGPYKSDWAGPSIQRAAAVAQLDENSPYYAENLAWKTRMDQYSGKQPGDPEQIAQVLLEAAESPAPPLHMVFGDVAIDLWEERMKNYADDRFIRMYPYEKSTL